MIEVAPVALAPKVQPTAKPASRFKSIVGGSVGNLVEWYDWFVFSSFSVYFAKSFFPEGDLTAQLLNTAAVFAAGFLIRPVGSWLMGLYADRRGRKAALTLSVLMMCFGSLLVATAPTCQAIGVASPLILVLARLLQGLSLGGEYGASAAYLSEMAAPGRRGFTSSFQYVTMILGQLLALGVLLLLQNVFLTAAQIEAWGWRIPFVIGAMCAVVALYMRRGMEETESFISHRETSTKRGGIRVLIEHPRAVLTVAGLTLGGTVAFYTYSAYMQKYLVNTVGWAKDQATLVSAGTLFIFMLLQPAFGALSDRIGRKPFILAFGILGALLTIPLFTALRQAHSLGIAFFLVLGALAIVSGYTSISAAVKAELFATDVRALGIGLPHAITVSLFGGTVECIALWFKKAGHESGFYWYVAGCIAISLVVYTFMPDTKALSAIDRGEGSFARGS